MRRDINLAAAAGALVLLGAGAANAADTLSWSASASTVAYCNFTQCGAQPVLVAGHDDVAGSDFNASTLTQTSHGVASAWADPGASGLLADLHAIAVAYGPAQTPGQANFAVAVVQGVQVYQWTGGSFDLDPTMFLGTIDYHADYAPAGPSGILAGFAILDGSVLASNDLATPWYNFGLNGAGGVTSAFQGDCSTPGAVGIASTGLDRVTSAPGVGRNTETLGLSVGATACNGKLHLENGDEFVLWSKLFIDRSAPGVIDATHTFSVNLDPNTPQDTVQTLASSIELQSYSYTPAPEPRAWALISLGFGGLGAALRRGRRRGAEGLRRLALG
ncbi:MAG: hypothetical protein JSS35_16720 [Proteobacteria bacterium]|nr:hypothetical protein [Pseudomonadota bacterium]